MAAGDPGAWAVRLACAAALAAVTAFGVARAVTVPSGPSSAPARADLCSTLRALGATALNDRVPPPASPPELDAYIERLNADMAYVRSQIKETCP